MVELFRGLGTGPNPETEDKACQLETVCEPFASNWG